MSTGRGSGTVRSRGVGFSARRAARRAARRRRPGRIRARLPRLSPKTVLVVVVVLALLGGAWLWGRQSSLVAIKRVSVAGASGPDAARIRSALISAARDMTTLDVQMSHLRTAVSPYPVVKGLQVSTQFPHGMRVRVIEHVPVAVVQVDGRRTPVAGDGTLLRDVTTDAELPSIDLSVAPGGTQLTGMAGTEVRMLAAAPYQLLPKVQLASSDSTHGLVVQLRNGPRVYFGGADRLAAKWDAVTAVLAAPSSSGADYIDVSDPARPVAGTGTDGGAATTSGSPPSTGSSGGTGTAG
ncbi:MAG TPA: cell division protein FtsQ/DivIB [Solirubrobacteraceae bacterium]|nr:cell division protein FtsQ/DivIB [Solirubrobacteraceae bacterium]